LDLVIQKNSKDAPALNNRGIARAELGDAEGAMEYYDKAIQADSSYAPAYYNKGVLLDKKLEHEKALEVLDEAIKIDPKKPNPRFYKGIVLGKTGKHELALNCFENVYRANPQHLDSLFHKGIELAELERHEKAIEVFDKIKKHPPGPILVVFAPPRRLAALIDVGGAFAFLLVALVRSGSLPLWACGAMVFGAFSVAPAFRRLVGCLSAFFPTCLNSYYFVSFLRAD
jgi:FOG: TPR repeat